MVSSRSRTAQATCVLRHGEPAGDCPYLDLGRVPNYHGTTRYDDRLYLICEPVEMTPRATPAAVSVIAAIRAAYARADRTEPIPALVAAVSAANHELYTRNHRGAPDARVFLGVTCLLVRQGELVICQVPPTQALIAQNGTLLALPELVSWRDDYQPHSYTGEGPYGLGMHADVDPQLYRTTLEEGDLLALVSSNLARILADERVDPLVGEDPVTACEYLTDLATDRDLDLAYAAAIAAPLGDALLPRAPESAPGYVLVTGERGSEETGTVSKSSMIWNPRNTPARMPGWRSWQREAGASEAAFQPERPARDGAGGRFGVGPGEFRSGAAHAAKRDPAPTDALGLDGDEAPIYTSRRLLFGVAAGGHDDVPHRAGEAPLYAVLDEADEDDDDDVEEDEALDEVLAQAATKRNGHQQEPATTSKLAWSGDVASEFDDADGDVRYSLAYGEAFDPAPATWQAPARPASERVARPLPLGSLERWDRGMGRRARGAVAVALFVGIALIAVTGSYATRVAQANAADKQFGDQVAQIAAARQQAVANPNKQAAHDQLLALRESLSALPAGGNARWQDAAATEATALASALDAVDGVTRIDPNQIRLLAQGPVPGGANATPPRLVLGNGQLFVLRDGTLFMADPGKQAYTRLLGRGDVVDGKAVGSLRGIVWRGDLLLAFDESQAYTRATTTWSATPLASKGLQPVAVDTFDRNLYFLVRDSSEIVKFADGQYNSQPQIWANAKNSANLTQGIDLAIDRDIYLLLADGRIADLYQGAEKGLFTPRVVPPLTSATALYAVQGGKYLYLLDAASGRILRLTRDGAPLATYKAPSGTTTLTSATDLVVDEPANVAYLTTDAGIVAVQLPAAP